MKDRFLWNPNITIETEVKHYGEGFGEISLTTEYRDIPRKIVDSILITKENQTKEALKSLGYIYLSENTRIRLKEELYSLKVGAYDLFQIKELLETILEGE